MIGIGVNQNKSSELENSTGQRWSNPTIRYARPRMGKLPSVLSRRTETDVVHAVALSSDGRIAAEGTSEGFVFTFAPFEENYSRSRPRKYPITLLSFSPDSKSLAAATGAGGWSIFDVATRKDLITTILAI